MDGPAGRNVFQVLGRAWFGFFLDFSLGLAGGERMQNLRRCGESLHRLHDPIGDAVGSPERFQKVGPMHRKMRLGDGGWLIGFEPIHRKQKHQLVQLIGALRLRYVGIRAEVIRAIDIGRVGGGSQHHDGDAA